MRSCFWHWISSTVNRAPWDNQSIMNGCSRENKILPKSRILSKALRSDCVMSSRTSESIWTTDTSQVEVGVVAIVRKTSQQTKTPTWYWRHSSFPRLVWWVVGVLVVGFELKDMGLRMRRGSQVRKNTGRPDMRSIF